MAKKILAVDDSISVRTSISFILGQEGYEIVEANDGIDALAKAKTDKFNLVITDINMPNMDGIELTKQLRQTEGYKFTPIIALTTENQQSKMDEGKIDCGRQKDNRLIQKKSGRMAVKFQPLIRLEKF